MSMFDRIAQTVSYQTLTLDSPVQITIKRLDQIHPHISGNKFFKLKHNLLEAQKQADRIIAAADSVGNLLILQAEKQGQELVKKANNPITKAAAEIASKKLVDEARKKATEGKAKAQTEAQKIIQKASESVEI